MKILLHCCCGPCSTASISRLLEEGWEPVLFYGNSNIYPASENELRRLNLEKVARFFGLEIVRAPYNHEAWLLSVKGLEAEKEHGRRCVKCFEYNLREAEAASRALGINHFTTSLTVSRYKKSSIIFEVGRAIPGFEEIDFKKKDGFAKSVRMRRSLDLYRQSYCGCEFSLRDSANRDDGNAFPGSQVRAESESLASDTGAGTRGARLAGEKEGESAMAETGAGTRDTCLARE